jgi:hypothetical protein
MSTKKIKKDLRLKLEETLSQSVVNLNGEISPKKLKRNVKKASKALLAGLKVTPGKTKEEKKDKAPALN